MTKIIEAREVAKKIPDMATLAFTGCGYRLMPELILATLEERFKNEGKPKGLELVFPIMVEKARAGIGGAGSGINHLAHEGMLRRIVGGSFSRSADREINRLISSNKVEGYNLPMGTVFQLFRATAAGRQGLFTKVGLDTFVDPRLQGGKLNKVTKKDIAKVITIEGEEYLYYPSISIDVALISGTYGDEKGNLSIEHEAFSLGILYLAMAAKNSGGRVIAQVKKVVARGELIPPKKVAVPGALIDNIVVYDNTFEDERDPRITGEIKEIVNPEKLPFNISTVIAKRAFQEFKEGQVINLGAGLPMFTIPRVARNKGMYKKINFTIEQGPFGGLPGVGGVAKNPEFFFDSLEVFDFYEGGGIDVACLSFAQVDRNGNVNVSRFADMMPGCGGFMNITYRTKNIIFCGSLMAKGLDIEFDGRNLKIISEGKIQKFVPEVEYIDFNGRRALEKRQNVIYITERAVFKLEKEGIKLVEIAPGIDIEEDILPYIGFDVKISSKCAIMDSMLFKT